METNISKIIEEFFMRIGAGENLAVWLKVLSVLVVVMGLAWLSDFITKRFFLTVVARAVKKTKTKWDDILLEKRIFKRMAHWAPALVVYYSIHLTFNDFHPEVIPILQGTIKIYMIFILLLVMDSFLEGAHHIYQELPFSKSRPITGYVQLIKIFVFFVGGLFIISILLNKDMSRLLAGLGAMAAVLMLVFKDTILGLVASVQLSANDMVKIGDWVSIPKFNADGTVLNISLNTVKVQNWDKTISTIPTYALVSESFANWKGMEESGGRRIKRHINIDMKSVTFCSSEMIAKLKKIQVLKSYIEDKESEIDTYNTKMGIEGDVLVNGRRMTNLGVFRAYIENYLHNHPDIREDMTFLVRQLQPTDTGLPIEIYVFSNVQEWAAYESIQADIFDHIIAALPEFELRVFQNPTGYDFEKLAE